MRLTDFIAQVSGFDAKSTAEKVRLFCWFLHTQKTVAVLKAGDIRTCFEELHIPPPNISMYLTKMSQGSPPRIARSAEGYKLTRAGRSDLDTKYGAEQTFVQVSKLLNDLPGNVPDLAERLFLSEAISCYHVGAFRACVVMTWNLAYSHLLHWIIAEPARVASFNAAITVRFPRKIGIVIATYDDFSESLKESEVIEVCGTAALLNSNIIRILREKLGKRNSSAHPSSITVVQSQADDVVTDLVNNVVLALS